MQKKQVIPFVVFGIVMAAVHFVQCLFRVKTREVFLRLTAAPTPVDNALWHQLSDYGRYTEIIYYTIGIAFMIFVGYRLIYGKVRFRFAIPATVIVYAISAVVGIVFHFQSKGVSNFFVPVFASFFFALFIFISSGIKRYQYQKIAKKNLNPKEKN